MDYSVFTENPEDGKPMLIAICVYRDDAQLILRNWANGYVELEGKMIWQKG